MGAKKILIADDEARMRKLVGDFLKKEGYSVIEAADGRQALKLFWENEDLDLIILDVMMPGYDGWTVCREVRKQSQVPIIMLTAILNAVWNFDYFGDVRTVDTHIKKLRLKLGDKSEFIQTVRGLGYRFEVRE